MFGEPLPPKPALTPPRAAAQPAVAMPAPGPRSVDSATLLGPGGELFIHHQQQVYRLRLTSQGKLILTK